MVTLIPHVRCPGHHKTWEIPRNFDHLRKVEKHRNCDSSNIVESTGLWRTYICLKWGFIHHSFPNNLKILRSWVNLELGYHYVIGKLYLTISYDVEVYVGKGYGTIFWTFERSLRDRQFKSLFWNVNPSFLTGSQMVEIPGNFPGFVVSRTPHVRYRGHHPESKKKTVTWT